MIWLMNLEDINRRGTGTFVGIISAVNGKDNESARSGEPQLGNRRQNTSTSLFSHEARTNFYFTEVFSIPSELNHTAKRTLGTTRRLNSYHAINLI